MISEFGLEMPRYVIDKTYFYKQTNFNSQSWTVLSYFKNWNHPILRSLKVILVCKTYKSSKCKYSLLKEVLEWVNLLKWFQVL